MSIADRGYFREGAFHASGWGGTPWTWGLLTANLALWLVYAGAFRSGDPGPLFGFLDRALPLRAADVVGRGRVWQLATHAFVHAPGSALPLAFDLVALFFFGREVERMLPRGGLARLFLLSGAAAGMLAVPWAYLVGRERSPFLGSTGAVLGVMVAFACRRPSHVVFPGIPAWLFVVVVAALPLLAFAGGSGDPLFVAHLGGAAAGWLHFALGGRVGAWWRARASARDAAAREAARVRDDADRRRLDDLLEKINRGGIGSLTEEEREFLRAASRRPRG